METIEYQEIHQVVLITNEHFFYAVIVDVIFLPLGWRLAQRVFLDEFGDPRGIPSIQQAVECSAVSRCAFLSIKSGVKSGQGNQSKPVVIAASQRG